MRARHESTPAAAAGYGGLFSPPVVGALHELKYGVVRTVSLGGGGVGNFWDELAKDLLDHSFAILLEVVFVGRHWTCLK